MVKVTCCVRQSNTSSPQIINNTVQVEGYYCLMELHREKSRHQNKNITFNNKQYSN